MLMSMGHQGVPVAGGRRPVRCVSDGFRKGADVFDMRLCPFGPERQHFFWTIPDDVRALVKDGPGARRDGQRIPRRADAKPVQQSLTKGVDHEGRRHDDEPDFLVGLDLASPHP